MRLQLPRYTITEQLHAGAATLIHRGSRLADGLPPVILKTPRAAHPTPQQLLKWRYEYDILGSLQVPGVVEVVALDEEERRPVLVLRDIGGAALARMVAAARLPLPAFSISPSPSRRRCSPSTSAMSFTRI